MVYSLKIPHKVQGSPQSFFCLYIRSLTILCKQYNKIAILNSSETNRNDTATIASDSSYQLSITPGTCTTLPHISPWEMTK